MNREEITQKIKELEIIVNYHVDQAIILKQEISQLKFILRSYTKVSESN